MLAQLQHLAQHGDAAPRAPLGRQRAQRLRQRRRARVVGVVDHHHVVAQPPDHPAPIRRADARHAVAHDLQRHAAGRRHRGRRQHVGQVGPAEERRLEHRLAVARHHGGARAVEAAVLDLGGAHLRARRLAEGHRAARKGAAAAGDARIVGRADEQRRGVGALEDLGLGVGDGVARREEPQVGVADVGPDAHFRLGDAHQRRISPAWFMPSSNTATSGAWRSWIIDSGRPMWLFRLPLFFTTLKLGSSALAVSSFVVVFPALPVIATTRVVTARRIARASACSACSGSSTTITLPRAATLGMTFGPLPRHHRARRATLERDFHEVVAVEPRSGQRHERVAGSDCAAVGDHVGHRPGLDAAKVAADRLGNPRQRQGHAAHDTLCPRHAPLRQRGARHGDVVEGQGHAADFLVLLVALAGDEDRDRRPPPRGRPCGWPRRGRPRSARGPGSAGSPAPRRASPLR